MTRIRLTSGHDLQITTMSSRTRSALSFVALSVLLAACASGGGGAQPSTNATSGTGAAVVVPDAAWPVKTREHVDLWLHGFAMIQDDTTKVPYFRRGYRDELIVERNKINVTSQLDANRDKLRARLAVNPNLVSAQFLALNFESWDSMRQALKLFIDANGDPRRASSQDLANAIAVIGQYFQSAADRDWLNTFYTSLDDENTRFYAGYWKAEQRERAGALAAFDSLWQKVYYPKLTPFLAGTRQRSGELLVSLPLDGEGRTISGGSKSNNVIVVAYPRTAASALESVYVFAHEAVGAVSAAAVSDNVTPAERRAGLADRVQSAAAVRGGLMLLERAVPELADGYARHYLASANVPVGADAKATLIASFPLSELLRDAISRQIDIVFSGI
jgi:hypothetical protein